MISPVINQTVRDRHGDTEASERLGVALGGLSRFFQKKIVLAAVIKKKGVRQVQPPDVTGHTESQRAPPGSGVMSRCSGA